MLLPQNYIGLFCEVRRSYDGKTLYTGHVSKITDSDITISSVSCFCDEPSGRADVIILSQSRGLNVFKADISVSLDRKNVVFTNLEAVTNTERRGGYRVPTSLMAQVTDEAHGFLPDATITDISITGCSISIPYAFQPNDSFRIYFTFDGRTLHHCDCNIVRNIGSVKKTVRSYGCGFFDVDATTLAALKSYVTRIRTEIMRTELFKQ